MRFEFIGDGDRGLSVKRACGTLSVSRGGRYEFAKRPKSRTRMAREAPAPFVEEAFYANGGRYGPRRVTLGLEKEGVPCSRGTVQRMMGETGPVSYRAERGHGKGGEPRTKAPTC